MQNYNNIEANEYDLFQYFQILMTTANKVQSFENLSAETIIPSALFFCLLITLIGLLSIWTRNVFPNY